MDDPPTTESGLSALSSQPGDNVSKPRLLWIALLLLYAGAIFAWSGLPMAEEKPFVSILHGDKFLHVVEYFLFYLLCWKAVPSRHRMLCSLVLTGAYAGTDEIHQLFVPTRSASVFDWLADLAGGVAAAALIFLLIRLPLSKR